MPPDADTIALPAPTRSSTLSHPSIQSYPDSFPELHNLINTLVESTADRNGVHAAGSFRFQCDDLQRLQQILVDDGYRGTLKSAFRQLGGFAAILGVLQTLHGFFTGRRLSRDDRTEFFHVVKSVLDVLLTALLNHTSNKIYFKDNVGPGGWDLLEKSLLDTGIVASSEDSDADIESLEMLFGVLLASALGEETVKGIFRSTTSVSEEGASTNGSNALRDQDPAAAFHEDTAVAKSMISQLSGLEMVYNPHVLCVLLRIWIGFVRNRQQGASASTLIISIPVVIRLILQFSLRNTIALHETRILGPLLGLYATLDLPSSLETHLAPLISALLDYGLNNMDDAITLFQNAARTSRFSKLLLHGMRASRSPPIIHFDMTAHGYSSLDLPAIGRPFPPSSAFNGYTIMAWVRFDRFDANNHTTIFGASDPSETCFVLLFVEKDDRQLVLQTSVKDTTKASVRFRSTTFQEGQWYHIAVVHRRPRTATSSRATLFIDGLPIERLKCQYPAHPPSRNSSAESFATITGTVANFPAVQAFLGSPKSISASPDSIPSVTRWSLASFYLFTDVVSDEMLQIYHSLGPRYIGNFQDTLGSFQTYRASAELHLSNTQAHPHHPDKSELMVALRQHANALLPESKIAVCFSPTFTLDSDDQNQINESRLIKNLPTDAAYSLQRTLRNRAACLVVNSAVNPISEAALVSHGLGFLNGDPIIHVPVALDDACWRLVGSAPVVLKLLDLAKTKDEVIRAVQITFSSLSNNWRNSEAFERENAYGVLAGLIREKLGFGSSFLDDSSISDRSSSVAVESREREELALELLRMILAFVGFNEESPDETLLTNGLAYRFLLVDFDTWRRAPVATQKLYYSQFVQFTARGKHHKFNASRFDRMRIVKRLLEALKAETFSADVFPDFLEAFDAVLRCSISAENLRSVAMFIGYILQESRSTTLARYPSRSSRTNHLRTISRGRERAASLSQPFIVSQSPARTVSKFDIGVQMLEIFADILCQPNRDEIINKFATTVSNKWLLFLLAERDARIVVPVVRILVHLLNVHGPKYMKTFAEKSGGFVVLEMRLKIWWSVPSLWIYVLALLFGVNISTLELDGDFNQFTLGDMFARTGGKVMYPEALPILASMLDSGLRNVVLEGQKSGKEDKSERAGDNASFNVAAVHGYTINQVTNNAEVLNTVIRFLSDMHLKSSKFREFAAASDMVQEFLFVLYPIVVTADVVSAEVELNSRGSALTFEGQDVVINSQISNENLRPSIVRSTTEQSSETKQKDKTRPRRATFRRPSNFVVINDQGDESFPKPARLHAGIIAVPKLDVVASRVGSSIVQNLLGMVISVYLDQILYRKEFSGFGLFLKVPPGFQEHQAYFKSYVLSKVMSELSNTLRMQEQLLKEPRVITNLARYTTYMSEAIFEGWYLNGSTQLLDFVGQVLEVLRRKDIASIKNVRLCSQAIDSMQSIFLRIALLQLSEMDEVKDVKETVSYLEKLAYWLAVIMSSGSDDPHFLRLLFFLLYFRITSETPKVRTSALDFWRMVLVQKQDEASHILHQSAPSSQRYLASGFMKLAELDNDTFMVWMNHHRPEVDDLFLATMTRYWDEFVAEENKHTEESSRTRLHKRRDKLKLWQEEESLQEAHYRKHEHATSHWRVNLHASERIKQQRAMQDQQDNLNFMATTLDKFDRLLKGPVSIFEHDASSTWRLDETEGQNRMRLRMTPDRSLTTDAYQSKRKISEQAVRRSTSISLRDSSVGSTSGREANLINRRSRADSRASQMSEMGEEEFELVDNPHIDEGGAFEDKHRKVIRSLQRGDKVRYVCNIARIDGLEALEGLFIVGEQCLYLIDHYFQRLDGEVVGAWQAPAEERDPYLQIISGKQTKTHRPKVAAGERVTRHWKWTEVMLVSKRRFLLRDVAMELFFTDGRSYLLTAKSVDLRDHLHSLLLSRAPLLTSPTSALHLENQWRVEALRNPEDVPQTFGSKFASVFNTAVTNAATRKWMKGEISNFAYLMQVNTMAGRTFNDLTQYPVFPWVLADYTSEELDLTNPHVFRDLSKPMGCQHPSREAEYREKFASIAEMTPDPPYHYGTHYSSAMTVVSYLIRLQPFVKSYMLLQGGAFDHADRLFYSIEKAWTSASRDTPSDVRELIPEFYYLPEFLTNANHFDFGSTQGTGQVVGDVMLPPWAKGDPQIFIQKHREALESPYVSAHLHKWIDLVFGFKQQGEAAVEATNVFHHLSYHGAKDLDTILDSTEREASIGIIHNFGQTPRQVFVKYHPAKETNSAAKTKDLNNILDVLSRSHAPVFERNESVAGLFWSAKLERIIQQGPLSLYLPSGFEVIMRWGYADGSVRFHSQDGKKLLSLYENFHVGPVSTAIFIDGQTLVTAGQDGVMTVWNIATATGTSATAQTKITAIEVSQRESLFGHRLPITLLATSKSLSTLLSADSSGRVLLWDLNRDEYIRELHPGPQQNIASSSSSSSDHEITAACISAASGDIALCTNRQLFMYTLNGTLLLSKDVCDDRDPNDRVTASAWYEGTRGDWVQRVLLLTGHLNGAVRVWHRIVDPRTGKYALQCLRKLPPAGHQNQQHQQQSRSDTFMAREAAVRHGQQSAAAARPGHVPPLAASVMTTLPGAVAVKEQQRSFAQRGNRVTAILPQTDGVWVGDERGRVYEWTADGRRD